MEGLASIHSGKWEGHDFFAKKFLIPRPTPTPPTKKVPSLSIAIPSYGWIAFLSYDVKSSLSKFYKARLHSPVDKISAIRQNL